MAEVEQPVADDAESDAEIVYGDDADAGGWYAAAAGDGDGEEEEEEEEEPAGDVVIDAQEGGLADDPYAVVDDPYAMVADDPYAAAGDPDAEAASTPAAAPAAPAPAALAPATPAPSTRPLENAGDEASRKRLRTEAQAPKTPLPRLANAGGASPRPPPPVLAGSSPKAPPPLLVSPSRPPPGVRPPPPQLPPLRPAAHGVPPPAPPMPLDDAFGADMGEELEEVEEPEPDLEVDAEMAAEMPDYTSCVVVRQGQLYIELMHRKPPMDDATLQIFCDWLDSQMPLVVSNFPYIKRSGAYLDLSDNSIGPEGLDRLFRVLRDHKVPCVVMKAFRNALDDSIVDTLIEYLYTQPESFPMHGIHISHNSVTDKGALRLIKAAAQCGHYPRLTSRLPLWMRLESNAIQNPQKVITDCQAEGHNVCLMGDGECSRPDCNHYSNVHVQLPYFFNQRKDHSVQKKGGGKAAPQVSDEDQANELLGIYRPADADSPAADWQRGRADDSMQAAMMLPAPKRRGAPLARPSMANVIEEPLADAFDEPYIAIGGTPDAPIFSINEPDPVEITGEFFGDGPSEDSGSPKGKSWKGGGGKGWKGGGGGKSWKGGGVGAWKGDGGSGKGDASSWKGDGGGGKGWKDQNDDWGKGGKGGKGGKDGKDGKGKKGKGKGKGGKKGDKKGPDWVGPTIVSKLLVKKDVTLNEGETRLGFKWEYLGNGAAPRVVEVDPSSTVARVAEVGRSLLRMNGLDAAMLTEKQITDVLKTRPMALRFGNQ